MKYNEINLAYDLSVFNYNYLIIIFIKLLFNNSNLTTKNFIS